jgi:DNA-binding CsgD family transcriptional regulator
VNRGDGLTVDAQRRLDSRAAGKGAPGLAHWLARVRDMPATDQAHFLDGCTVPRDAAGVRDARRYSVQCAPVPAAAAWRAADQAVHHVVFITDPSNIGLPDAARLHQLYGLTATQSRIAREFCKGGTYKQVAKRLRVSEETVRSHIKEIYPKMRVNRLADLVRMVLSLGQSGV